MLEVALLGQPSLGVAGERVAVPTRKSLALIAYLAIEGPAPRARLADVLWPSVDPDKGRGNLRRELNRLRHTPLGGTLVTDGANIALAQPFVSDVREFLNAVEARQPALALSHYRGPLLDGLELFDSDGFDDWLAHWRGALSERQRSMLAMLAEERERSGDVRGALQAYLDLVRLDQTQERYHREAMRLHYLVGEREAALERFARLKKILRRELALAPLPETLELYRTIRAAEELPSRAAEGPRPLLLDPPLVGRAAAWKVLAESDEPLHVLVAEPGIGKTRLAEEFARGAGSYLLARASDLSLSTPLYPFASALSSALENREQRRRLEELKPVFRREAARLVPALDPDAPADSLPNEARARFLEALAQALAAAIGRGGALLLDDLHWFDAASVELALHLVRRARDLGIRILATARPMELRTSPGQRLLQIAAREGLGATLELGPLADEDVAQLLGALSRGKSAPSFARFLHRSTEGNPLYILETLKTLLGKGDLVLDEQGFRSCFDATDSDLSELPVPSGVRDAVLAQVEPLGPAVRRLLDAASLAGPHFSLDDLGGATGLDAFEEIAALEHAVAAGLLERAGDGTRFHHDLVRRALADALGDERKKLLHEKLGASLARRGEAAARVADHLLAAGEARAAVFRLRAAENAHKLFAYDEALAQYASALAGQLPTERIVEIHLRRIGIYRALDDRAAWGAEVDALEALASEPRHAAFRARATLARAELSVSAGRYADALLHADAAKDAARDDPSLAARAELEGARALIHLARVDEAIERLGRALALAEDSDLALTSEIHRARYACSMERNDLDQALRDNAAARRADEARGDRHGLIQARLNEGTIRRRAGDLQAAAAHLETALAESRDAGFVSLERSALLALASVHNLLGEYDRAAELAETGIELAKQPEDPLLEARFANALAAFEYSRGRLGSSISCSERAIEVAVRISAASWSAFFRYGLAHTLLELGAHARARDVIEDARHTVDAFHVTGQHVVLETHRAHADLFLDDPGRAAVRITRAVETSTTPSLDPDYTFAVLALAQHVSGDSETALATLDRHSFRPLHRSRALAVRIDARRALGRDLERELGEAEALLADPRLTPVESLELSRALIRSSPGSERALGHQRRAAALVAELARSLAGRPEIRERFLAHNADLAALASG